MPKPDINVTPLIDVLLVLLIIFMIISPLKPAKFEAKIPQPPDPDISVPADSSMLVVVLRNDGSLTLNGMTEYSSFAELEKLTGDIVNQIEYSEGPNSAERRVFVKAPKSMSYGNVVRVIDAVKTAGVIPLSLQIDDLDS